MAFFNRNSEKPKGKILEYNDDESGIEIGKVIGNNTIKITELVESGSSSEPYKDINEAYSTSGAGGAVSLPAQYKQPYKGATEMCESHQKPTMPSDLKLDLDNDLFDLEDELGSLEIQLYDLEEKEITSARKKRIGELELEILNLKLEIQKKKNY